MFKSVATFLFVCFQVVDVVRETDTTATVTFAIFEFGKAVDASTSTAIMNRLSPAEMSVVTPYAVSMSVLVSLRPGSPQAGAASCAHGELGLVLINHTPGYSWRLRGPFLVS